MEESASEQFLMSDLNTSKGSCGSYGKSSVAPGLLIKMTHYSGYLLGLYSVQFNQKISQ